MAHVRFDTRERRTRRMFGFVIAEGDKLRRKAAALREPS